MLSGLFTNRILWTAVLADLLAQLWKVTSASVQERRFAAERFVETGGMPSSHAATVTALAAAIAMRYGMGSVEFAMAAIFAAIVLHDAAGIRQAAGKQADLINDLVLELQHILTEGFRGRTLRTLLGHTIPQVMVGALLGLIIGVVLNL
jgi:uncharacterized protein